MPRIPVRTVLPPLLAAALASVALSACGGSSPSSGRSDEEKRLAFVDCLRDQGVDVSSDGRRFAVRVTERAGDGGATRTFGPAGGAMRDAFEACRRKTGWAPSPPTAAQMAEMRDRGLRMARCMRAHGVDMPDPQPDGRMMMRVDGRDPDFEDAARACGMGVLRGPRGAAGLAMGAR